jgi:hypothetical protein
MEKDAKYLRNLSKTYLDSAIEKLNSDEFFTALIEQIMSNARFSASGGYIWSNIGLEHFCNKHGFSIRPLLDNYQNFSTRAEGLPNYDSVGDFIKKINSLLTPFEIRVSLDGDNSLLINWFEDDSL